MFWPAGVLHFSAQLLPLGVCLVLLALPRPLFVEPPHPLPPGLVICWKGSPPPPPRELSLHGIIKGQLSTSPTPATRICNRQNRIPLLDPSAVTDFLTASVQRLQKPFLSIRSDQSSTHSLKNR